MSVRGLVTVVIGVVAYIVIDTLIAQLITGTDVGATLLTGLVRIVVAASIIIGVVTSIGRRG